MPELNDPLAPLATASPNSSSSLPEDALTDSGVKADPDLGRYRVVRRDGRVAPFRPEKIAAAMTKAFVAAQERQDEPTARAQDLVADLTDRVVAALTRRRPAGGEFHIEEIQDQVELALMRAGEHQVARRYVLYREERARAREAAACTAAPPSTPPRPLHVTYPDGSLAPLDLSRLEAAITAACADLGPAASAAVVLNDTLAGLYDGIPAAEVARMSVMAARARIETEPEYRFVAARLLLDQLSAEVFGREISPASARAEYAAGFAACVRRGVQAERLDPRLLEFDLERLGGALAPERDRQFAYLGLQTLYDRYLIHVEGRRIELPQWFWMRIAMGLALEEIDREERATQFYEVMSRFRFVPSTPTLFNAGTRYPQLSSCYLTTVEDDLGAIFDAIRDNALLSKFSGGLGNDWTPVRALGAPIRSTNGKSQGIVPFLKVANDTAVAVNQGGKRQGAVCAYLEPWHLDIEEFLDLRKNTGDDRRRTHDMHTAVWVPDLFLQRVAQGAPWALFSPDEVPDLHDLYGRAFAERYAEHEARAAAGEIRCFRVLPAEELWRKILTRLYETGHPWITFKDPANLRSPQRHAGVVHSSNLCTEILLNTNREEVAVCFPRGTMILTEAGTRPIEECGDSKVWVPFQSDTDFTNAPRYVQARLQAQGVKSVYEICGKGGLSIRATADHPFLVQRQRSYPNARHRGGNAAIEVAYEWVRLQDLQEGDLLVAPHHGPMSSYALSGATQDTDFLVAGWVLGDGWQTRDSYGAVFGPKDKDAQEVVIPRLKQWHASTECHPLARHRQTPGVQVQPNGVVMWGSKKTAFITHLNERFGFRLAKAGEKSVAPQIQKSAPSQLASFLSGLFSADGCVQMDDRTGRRGSIEFSSASRQLLQDVQLLLKNFGIHTRVNYGEVATRPGRFQGQLRTSTRESVLRFWQCIGFKLAPDKQAQLDELINRLDAKPETPFEGGYAHMAVRSVRYAGEEEVFDLTLEEGHHFVANGVVVHNCNLGSVNVAAHVAPPGMDQPLLAETVRTGMRMLDNVIDLNYYAVPEARASNLRHRPVGLGLMGFQDALHLQRVPFASDAAMAFADRSMEAIAYHAILASAELAAERGPYASFHGSLWDQGLLPQDTLDLLAAEREGDLDVDRSSALDWAPVREAVRRHGMRNSNCMAIAPTATIANIAGVSASIEPHFSNLFVKSNLSGEFTVINPYLVEDLRARGLWNRDMLDDLKYFDGVLAEIDRVPADLKTLYATAFEIEPHWLIEAASRRQKWLDMGQSLNLYVAGPTGPQLSEIYFLAWRKGLKTTYYLRTRAATQVEKSTLDLNRKGIQPRWMKSESPSARLAIPREEGENGAGSLDSRSGACHLDAGGGGDPCEACQ
jgi:ribonucleoside-diphosphate reductase alpha chain